MKDAQVVHIVPALFGAGGGIVGGAERYALELARHMAEITPTRLVSFGPQDETRTIGALPVTVIGNPHHVRGLASNPFSWRTFGEIRGARIVHCHQRCILTSSAVALAGRLTGKRVFVSDLGGGGWDISSYVSTDRWYHGHLHISEYSRAVAGQADRPWSHVIMGGVDTEKFSPYDSTPRDGSVLFVGRILPHKGIHHLIEALPHGMRLRIIGQPYHADYLARLKDMARSKEVAFDHGCTDEELVGAYRAALCVVLPSVYRDLYGKESKVPELLGQALLEAMACGTPAICTDVASMPEVVRDGVTGFVVPPYDPRALGARLRWLADHPEDVTAMGRAARRRVLDSFTWPAVARRCLEIYES
jgi:glycosyltransferase involved in cell wall biosynthesis